MRKSILLIASIALALFVACGVTLSVGGEPARAAFPGTNGKIVFDEYDEEEYDSGIKLINQNGTGETTLLASGSSPAMSSDGARVAYSKGTNAKNREIYKINIANRRVTRITNNEVFDDDPTWSPDGTRVAFVRGERIQGSIKNTDIFVRRADGTGTTLNVTNTPNEDEYAPAWSPNGKKIAFHTRAPQEFGAGPVEDVFVLDLQTGQKRNLTDDGTARADSTPSWSPDGTRIVFESYTPGEQPDYISYDRIYTMDASDGSDRRLLAEASDNDIDYGSYFSGTTYSPDGKQIAYVKSSYDYVYSNARLYKMTASTGGNKRLVYLAYSFGSGYPYGEGVYLDAPDWGDKVEP